MTRLPITAALALPYFLVLTPIGLVLRVFSDPMARRIDRAGTSTYWIESGR